MYQSNGISKAGSRVHCIPRRSSPGRVAGAQRSSSSLVVEGLDSKCLSKTHDAVAPSFMPVRLSHQHSLQRAASGRYLRRVCAAHPPVARHFAGLRSVTERTHNRPSQALQQQLLPEDAFVACHMRSRLDAVPLRSLEALTACCSSTDERC